MAEQDKTDTGMNKVQEALRTSIEAKLKMKEIEEISAKNTEAILKLESKLDAKFDELTSMMRGMMKTVEDTAQEDQGNEAGVANDGEIEDENTSLSRKASEAQRKTPFNERRIYETLVKPREFNKKNLTDYAEAAIIVYEVAADSEVQELIDADFKFWTQQEFALLSNKQRTTIRDFLLERANAEIMAGKGVSVAKALGQYMEQVRVDEEEYLKRIEERRKKREADASSKRPLPNPIGMRNLSSTPNPVEERHSTDTSDGAEYDDARRRVYRGRASDVGKLFHRDNKYSGRPQENLRRRYGHFKNA